MLQPIVSSVLYLLLGMLLSSVGIVVGRKLYNNVKNEDHQEKGKVIQRIMKTYSMAQCIAWPCIMSLTWLLSLNKTVLTVIEPALIRHAIAVLRFLYTLFRGYVGFNSLIIAISRYSFIVWENQVFRFGIGRARYLFVASSMGIPVLLAFLNESTVPIEYPWRCQFMPGNNDTYHSTDNISVYCAKNTTEHILQSPIYNLFNEHFPSSVTYGMKICCFIIIVMAYSNIAEGLIYLHTYIHNRRYTV